MAELFQTSRENVTIHLKNIFEEGELDENSVCKDFFHTASVDYDPTQEESITFFKTVQNEVHYAITVQTVAEIIVDRVDSQKHKEQS